MRTRASTGEERSPSSTDSRGGAAVEPRNPQVAPAKKHRTAAKTKSASKSPPITPDGHYFIVRGRLWRCSNPSLPPAERQESVDSLMDARRDVKTSLASGDGARLKSARAKVQKTKEALGERGPVWWSAEDGGKWDRFLAKNTPYRDWETGLKDVNV